MRPCWAQGSPAISIGALLLIKGLIDSSTPTTKNTASSDHLYLLIALTIIPTSEYCTPLKMGSWLIKIICYRWFFLIKQ